MTVRRSPEEVRRLMDDAKKSEARRRCRGPIYGESAPRGRGGLGGLADSTRDGCAWVGHTSRLDLHREVTGEEDE